MVPAEHVQCDWEDCGLCFVDLGALVRHIEETHVGSEQPWKRRILCQWKGCVRTAPYTERTKFVDHLRVHTGEKPFACPAPDCEWEFSVRCNLVAHMKRRHSRALLSLLESVPTQAVRPVPSASYDAIVPAHGSVARVLHAESGSAVAARARTQQLNHQFRRKRVRNSEYDQSDEDDSTTTATVSPDERQSQRRRTQPPTQPQAQSVGRAPSSRIAQSHSSSLNDDADADETADEDDDDNHQGRLSRMHCYQPHPHPHQHQHQHQQPSHHQQPSFVVTPYVDQQHAVVAQPLAGLNFLVQAAMAECPADQSPLSCSLSTATLTHADTPSPTPPTAPSPPHHSLHYAPITPTSSAALASTPLDTLNHLIGVLASCDAELIQLRSLWPQRAEDLHAAFCTSLTLATDWRTRLQQSHQFVSHRF